MRGEGNWATLGMFASMEGRILSACDALLGCASFWFQVRSSVFACPSKCVYSDLLSCGCLSKLMMDAELTIDAKCLQGQRWLQKHAMSLERIAAARMPSEMAAAVTAIEESLAEAGLLSAAWLSRWQQRWRASVAACPDMRAVLLHVAALQVLSEPCMHGNSSEKPSDDQLYVCFTRARHVCRN